jgi:WD40 repeat protein/serine/threonine protein kinase
MAIDTLQGQIIKGYELQELIAKGGFGTVYRAKQSVIEREVAIKIILPELASQPEFIRRFDTEAQLVARLEHPHIVPLYDYWRNPDGAYLVMRYLRGGSLRNVLNNGAFDPKTCAHILDQLASALDLAHRHDVIHRDIKPANILLDEDGNAYLGDFGIAKDIGVFGSEITDSNNVVGSLDYITPEQAKADEVTARTDVYSLGILLYEMLTGEHPYAGVMSVQRVYKHMTEPVPEIVNVPDTMHDAVNEVIQKATEKEPSDRYESVLEFASAFRRALGLSDTQPIAPMASLLSLREREILGYLARGLDNNQMAENLSVTISTLRWHIQQVYQKLGVTSRDEALERARSLELIDADGRVTITDTHSKSAVLTLPEPINPYKGLRAFQSTDARDFFGREDQIEKLVSRMDEDHEWARFLAIVGPSGSGKSSLVRAGVIPALRRGALPHSDSWFFVEMIPGTTPIEQLLVALVQIAADDLESVYEQLKHDEDGILKAAEHILPDDGSELVLVIDQFEEIFTLVADEETRTHFMAMVRRAVTDPNSRVRIFITLRADFYDRPLQYTDFGELLRARMETVLPLSASGLERAIIGPAERVGVSFEPGLVAQIVAEMNHQAGALPLLQYALTELFDRRTNRLMTEAAYRNIGGAVGALAHRADELYQRMTEQGQQLTRQMFLRLVTLGEGSEDTRRRANFDELLSLSDNEVLMQEIIDTFARYRLLSLDHDPDTRKPTLEVAHEAILREWERLRGWLNSSRDDIRQQRTLAQLAHEWQKANQDTSYLLGGSRLDIFDSWLHETQLVLTPLEWSYLAASIVRRQQVLQAERAQQEREDKLERRARFVLTALVGVFALSTLIAILLTFVAFDARDNAQNNFTRAERIRLSAQAQIALDNGEDVIVPALLSLRSLQLGYSPEADATLLEAFSSGFSDQRYIGHTAEVNSVDFSPDNRFMVTASNDRTAMLWGVETGNELMRFEGHQGSVTMAVFSPDGRQIATASIDRTVRIWNVATGNESWQLPTHASPVWALAWSPDGTKILTSDESRRAYIWDVNDGQVLVSLNGHRNIVSFGAFSPDSRYVLTGSFDDAAMLWDAETGQRLQIFNGHSGCVCGGGFSADGQRVVTASYDQTARIWDVETGAEIQRFIGHNNILHDARFSPGGEYILTASQDRTARLWDASTGQELRQFIGHTGGANGVDFASDNRLILTASNDGTASLWDLQAETEPIILTPPLSTLRATNILYIEQLPDGRIIATGSGNGIVRFWSVERRAVLQEVSAGISGILNDIALSPNFIATAGNTVRLWDEDSGDSIHILDTHRGAVYALAFSHDNRLLLTGGNDGTARLWDTLTGTELLVLSGHMGAVRAVAFSPDDALLLTGGEDSVLRLWDAKTGQATAVLTGHEAAIRAVTFSPDGNLIASGSSDSTIRLWDVATGTQLRVLSGHGDAVLDLAFSPDGGRLLSGSSDQTARLWNVETGALLRHLSGHNDMVRSVAFSIDGAVLLTGDNVLTYLWTADLADVITLACDRIPRDFTASERNFYNIDSSETCPDS